MGRAIFESRYNRGSNRYAKNCGVMSEHEDIDSDFVHPHESDFIDSDCVHPSSERSIISAESDDNDEPYYSSDNSMKHQEITQVYDRTNSSDDDSVDIYSDSDNEGKHEGSNTSPTSSMSFSGREESIKVDNNKTKEETVSKKEKKGFFGKFFHSLKPNPMNMEVPTKRNSDLSDADIESALTSEKGYSSIELEFSVYEDSNNSQSQSHSRSQSTHYASESETSVTSSMVSPRRSLHKERISTLPDVAEGAEGEEDTVEEYRTYRRPMKGSDEPTSESLDKTPSQEIEVSIDEDKPEIAPEKTPDSVSPKLIKSKAASMVPQSPRSNTKSSKKKRKKKQKKKAHASALAARNHAVSSRIDYAGQISSATMSTPKKSRKRSSTQSKKELEAEVHRLRTLVELMMTRMELYERQAECLIETSLHQDREWKMATIEHYEEAAKKRKDASELDERLHSMTNLMAERNIQDKWIRQLECIQRGYEERLETTNIQLKDLRCQHVLTNKRIMDQKKSGCELTESTRTPDTFTEDITTSTKSEYHYMDEATTPTMANGNSPIERWVAPTLSGTTLSGTFTGPFSERSDRNGLDDTTRSNSTQSLETPGVKEYTSLLEEMIVSWHNDADEVSVLSEHGSNKAKKKPKKDKKKKKKKRSSAEIKPDNNDPKGGFFSN